MNNYNYYQKVKLKYRKEGKIGAIVIKNEKNEYLFGKRSHTNTGSGKWSMISGWIDEFGHDKNTMDTVSRECLEEIGIRPEKIFENTKYINPINFRKNKIYISQLDLYTGFISSDAKLKTNQENKELKWFKPEEIPWKDIKPWTETYEYLKKIVQNKKIEYDYPDKPDVFLLLENKSENKNNLKISVDPDKIYSVFYLKNKKSKNEILISLKSFVEKNFQKQEIEILTEKTGENFIGLLYEPFSENSNSDQIFFHEIIVNNNWDSVIKKSKKSKIQNKYLITKEDFLNPENKYRKYIVNNDTFIVEDKVVIFDYLVQKVRHEFLYEISSDDIHFENYFLIQKENIFHKKYDNYNGEFSTVEQKNDSKTGFSNN